MKQKIIDAAKEVRMYADQGYITISLPEAGKVELRINTARHGENEVRAAQALDSLARSMGKDVLKGWLPVYSRTKPVQDDWSGFVELLKGEQRAK